MAHERGATATTRSSSAAATTAWSPPPTSRAAGLRTLVLERRDTRRRRGRRRPSSRPASACRRSPTPSAGCGRRSSATSTSSGHGLSLVAPEVRVFAPSARRHGGHAVGRRRRDRRGLCAPLGRTTPSAYVEFDRLVRSLGRFLARARRPRRRPTSRRPGSATRWPGCSSGGRSAASAGTTAGRSCASCRWPSPTSWPSRSRPTRSRPRSPGAASAYTAMGPWSAGTTAVLLGDSAGNDGGAAGPDRLRPGRSGRAGRRARGGGARRRRRDPDRRRGRRDHARATAGRPASCWRAARRSRPARSSSARRPEADADRPGRPGGARAVAALAGRQHPDARHGRQGQPRARRACPRSRPRRGDDARCSAAGSSSRPASTRWSARSTPPSTAGSRTTRSSRRRSRRSPIRRSSTGAAPGTQVMSVHRPVRRRTPCGDGHVGRRGARRSATWSSRRSRRCAPGLVGAGHGAPGPDAARPRARLRPHRRPPAPRRARRSTSSSCGGRCSATPATASGSTGCTWRGRAPTPAAASPGSPARTRRARSSPTSEAPELDHPAS